jgi:hypothetical protein
MKRELRTLAAMACIPVGLLVLASCSESKEQASTATPTTEGQAKKDAGAAPAQTSEAKGQASRAAAFQPGEPGGVVVDTYEITATVTDINKDSRKVTLQGPAGRKITVKAGPNVVNFDQIQVGDQVKARVTQQLVIFMRNSNEPPDTAQAATVMLAPVGAKPGGLVADTVQITAKVKAINADTHEATLEFPDGSTQTFPVRKDVDLTQRKVGEEVVIRSTEALAILVEKP